MKKNTLYVIGIIFIVAVAGFFALSSNDNGSGNVTDTPPQGEANEVVIGMKNYNYYPNAINVKYGETVRISLDNSVGGCFRDFVIKDFGIREYLATPSDYVEFVADKKGTFTFACSMGMGVGKIVVE